MSNVKELVIDRLIRTYGMPPPTRLPAHEFPAFCEEYISSLTGFDSAVLKRAMDDVIKKNTYQMWPVVGHIYQTCVNHVPRTAVQSPNWGEEAKEAPTLEQVANVRRMAKLFRESVKPVVSRGKTAEEALEGTPYTNILKTNRAYMAARERTWRAAELREKGE